MTYVVVKMFTDLQDENYEYHPGMIYPREGFKATQKRIKELSTKNNKRKEVFIAELEERLEIQEPKKEQNSKEKPKKETKKTTDK